VPENEKANNGLTTRWIGRPTIYLEETGSTNDYLKANGGSLPQGTAVYTMRQTGGRGRRGKSWDDLGGKSVALSVLLKGLSLRSITALSLGCGLAAADGLKELTGRDCAIKWPNDILLQEKKLAGILCESFSFREERAAVVGIGVNLHQTRAEFMERGLPDAGSLFSETGQRFSPGEVIAPILNRLERVLEACERDGFPSVRERYERRCVNIGREVRVLYENGQRIGIATGISENGGLLVDSGGEIITVNSGEASIRGTS